MLQSTIVTVVLFALLLFLNGNICSGTSGELISFTDVETKTAEAKRFLVETANKLKITQQTIQSCQGS